ncbi:MAG: hypothetical protein EON59_11310 [Alphaproteobacteria bacterium]|nr:MAG: hypothetical protein EON59_11310 [Alphaproteobacteria bacterium]
MTSPVQMQDGPSGPTATVLEAIVRQLCVSGTYNRKRMILAPHIAYLRAGGLYVDALVISRENMLAREEKIGTFKIDGLSELALTQRPFAASDLFDPTLDKYASAVMAIEPQEAVAA